MAEDIYLQMQKLANQTQIKLQDMSDKTTAKTFKYNTKEAKTSRDWQEMMSNTSHQREVKDLKKAGLNPVLSANQGAQSYTTSSASGEAENPSSGIAQLAASEMSGMAGVRQSEIGAAATRHAAATTAAAQRAAAAQAAAAQRYAADMAYRTSAERNEMELEKTRIEAENRLDIIDKTPPSNAYETAWKAADQLGIKDDFMKSQFASTIRSNFYQGLSDPKLLFIARQGIKISRFHYNLSYNGFKVVSRCLNALNIRNTNYARDQLVQGIVFGQQDCLKRIAGLYKINHYRYRGSYYK